MPHKKERPAREAADGSRDLRTREILRTLLTISRNLGALSSVKSDKLAYREVRAFLSKEIRRLEQGGAKTR